MNKSRKKGKWIILVSGLVLASIIGAYIFLIGNKTEVEATGLEDGQKVVYAEIMQANGNEITYKLTSVDEDALEEVSVVEEDFADEADAPGRGNSADTENAEIGEDATSKNTRGQRPNMGEAGSEDMPEMSEEMMENMQENMGGQRPNMNAETGRTEESESEDIYTAVIPVGTEVTTKLGTVTTFSWLEAGDIIKMIVEEMEDGTEEIIEIEIVE
jgi:hypothetical protein